MIQASLANHNSTEKKESSRWLVIVEVLFIFCLFFLFAGNAPPSEGESHYLAKAKHYWNPSWCAGDLFLESADAHYAFYWVFGWVTKFFSLDSSTWILRIVLWGLLAISWQRLSSSIIARPLWSIFTAALFLVALQTAPMAGEWVVGGVEGKVAAYAALFMAIAAAIEGRWNRAWIWIGVASAFHVLVGGWGGVILGGAWCFTSENRVSLRSMLPGLAAGLGVALVGLLPAIWLTLGTPAEITEEANRIYVFERLPHHLVIHAFKRDPFIQFVICLVLGAWLAWTLRADRRLRLLWLVVTGALVIAVAGLVIDQLLLSQPALAAKLLKYYWYRMSDSMLSVGLAMAVAVKIISLESTRPKLAQGLLGGLVLVCTLLMIDHRQKRVAMPLPPSIVQSKPTPDTRSISFRQRWGLAPRKTMTLANYDSITYDEHYYHWVKVCEWIDQNTPAESRFLVPRSQQTFKWYAQRSDVANWKDIPQDAASIVKWQKTIDAIYPPISRRADLLYWNDRSLERLGKEFNAQYIVVDRTRSQRVVKFKRIYPRLLNESAVFEVYELPPAPRSKSAP